MHFKYFSIKEIKKFIQDNNLAILKKFGQNFLINSGVVDTIVQNSQICKEDLVIEIGCGLGSLTHKIIATECTLIGFEIDNAYIKNLKTQFGDKKNFNLIEGNFLNEIKSAYMHSMLIPKINGEKYRKIIFLGNLPYNITTPILEKIFVTPIYFDDIIFMIQKEVAERIIAREGTRQYGSLSIFCQFYSSPKIIANISPRSFYPSPKVESSLVHFKSRENTFNIINQKFFFKIVKSLFINRRKQIKNNLILSPLLNQLDKNMITKALEKANIEPTIRGEMLSIQKIVILSNELYKLQMNF
ncbi:MAG: ribosomal RNA small subunit methyltransferase A [Spirochaetes bacterium]|nr:ribosomal RNA small subunit methyltransferase A [Spirochaetota bacterium]